MERGPPGGGSGQLLRGMMPIRPNRETEGEKKKRLTCGGTHASLEVTIPR